MRELVSALAELLPFAGIGFADPLTTVPGDLPQGATALRRAEFAAGRVAAAQAMCALGLPALPVPMGADRAPIWPEGLTGSITHTRRFCLAAVSVGGYLGIDLEPDNALTPDLWDETLLLAEQAAIGADRKLATLIFCAKEATFKAQYPLTRQIFGFDRLHITLDNGLFTARFRADTGPILLGALWQGRYAFAAGHALAVLYRD